MSAYLLCRDDDAHRALERAEFLHVEAGDAAGAARCGFWIGLGLLASVRRPRRGGWFARAGRLLDGAGADCVERGYLLVPAVLEELGAGHARGRAAGLDPRRRNR